MAKKRVVRSAEERLKELEQKKGVLTQQLKVNVELKKLQDLKQVGR